MRRARDSSRLLAMERFRTLAEPRLERSDMTLPLGEALSFACRRARATTGAIDWPDRLVA